MIIRPDSEKLDKPMSPCTPRFANAAPWSVFLALAVVWLTFSHGFASSVGGSDSLAFISNCKSVYVFRLLGNQRRFLGTMGGSTLNRFKAAAKKAKPITGATGSADFEFVVAGDSGRMVLRIAAKARRVSLIGRPPERDLSFRFQVSLSAFAEDAALTRPSKLPKATKATQAEWAEMPRDLVSLFLPGRTGLRWNGKGTNPILVAIGIPIEVVRNEYVVPDHPLQYCVYRIAVEKYIFDETGTFDPLIEYNRLGGYKDGGEERVGDPLLKIGERYLLFLQPPLSDHAEYFGRRVHYIRPGEWVGVHPFLQTWLPDRRMTVQRDLRLPIQAYRFPVSKTTLVNRTESEVVSEIISAMREARASLAP